MWDESSHSWHQINKIWKPTEGSVGVQFCRLKNESVNLKLNFSKISDEKTAVSHKFISILEGRWGGFSGGSFLPQSGTSESHLLFTVDDCVVSTAALFLLLVCNLLTFCMRALCWFYQLMTEIRDMHGSPPQRTPGTEEEGKDVPPIHVWLNRVSSVPCLFPGSSTGHHMMENMTGDNVLQRGSRTSMGKVSEFDQESVPPGFSNCCVFLTVGLLKLFFLYIK